MLLLLLPPASAVSLLTAAISGCSLSLSAVVLVVAGQKNRVTVIPDAAAIDAMMATIVIARIACYIMRFSLYIYYFMTTMAMTIQPVLRAAGAPAACPCPAALSWAHYPPA